MIYNGHMTDILHIYTRVSTSSQEEEGTSLETQLELGVRRAEKLGMDHKVWNEGGRSSSKDDLSNRPVLTDLLQKVDDGEVQHLYVWNTGPSFEKPKHLGNDQIQTDQKRCNSSHPHWKTSSFRSTNKFDVGNIE